VYLEVLFFAGKHRHKGQSHSKFKGAIEESHSCLRAWGNHSQRWQGPKCYKGTSPRIEAWKTGLHARRTSILDVRMTLSKWYKWRGKVHKDMRTHRSEVATEPGQDGPGPVGPGRPAWPIPRSVRPPISWTWRSFNPMYVGAPRFPWEVIKKLEREEEGDHSREGSTYSKEATTSGGGRWGPTKTPSKEKEDSVGSVTMINDVMPSTLTG
jgi:hypothetical protein